MTPSKKVVAVIVMLLAANALLGLTCFFGEWAGQGMKYHPWASRGPDDMRLYSWALEPERNKGEHTRRWR
jgi:hypothetical protein